MPGFCDFCQTEFKELYISQHLRNCLSFIFPIAHFPLKEASIHNPEELVVRNAAGKLICKCINAKGELCSKTFWTQVALMSHLTRNKRNWQACFNFQLLVLHIYCHIDELSNSCPFPSPSSYSRR